MIRSVLHHYCRRYRTMWIAFTVTLLVLFISYIPIRLVAAHIHQPQPEAILTLGGGVDRELYTAEFAQTYPGLDVWVSTGMPIQHSYVIFQAAQIGSDRLHLDRRAIDTVTNFTSLVNDFNDRGIRHLFLITSDFHMRRAQAIAFLVLGSRGIAYTPVIIPSTRSDESSWKIVRDVGRSLLWLITGRTAASLHPQRRWQYLQSWRSWAQ